MGSAKLQDKYTMLPKDFDQQEFLKDIEALEKEATTHFTEEDWKHFERFIKTGEFARIFGLATAGFFPNLLTALAIAYSKSTGWAKIHHISHKAYDQVPGTPDQYKSTHFAKGKNRWKDYLDWIYPEAWHYGHDVLHHIYTNQDKDQDSIVRNTKPFQKMPTVVRHAAFWVTILYWRVVYYPPVSMYSWHHREKSQLKRLQKTLSGMITKSYLPYGLASFVVFPLCYSFLGPWGVLSAEINMMMADLITNIHTFFVTSTNHTGSDLYAYDEKTNSKEEWYLRQILSTANFKTGSEFNDYLHLWLNYQIEHHLWPSLPVSKYKVLHEKLKTLCQKHQIPYIQESIWRRFWKTYKVAVGQEHINYV